MEKLHYVSTKLTVWPFLSTDGILFAFATGDWHPITHFQTKNFITKMIKSQQDYVAYMLEFAEKGSE
jgi:hypothetical protein